MRGVILIMREVFLEENHGNDTSLIIKDYKVFDMNDKIFKIVNLKFGDFNTTVYKSELIGLSVNKAFALILRRISAIESKDYTVGLNTKGNLKAFELFLKVTENYKLIACKETGQIKSGRCDIECLVSIISKLPKAVIDEGVTTVLETSRKLYIKKKSHQDW